MASEAFEHAAREWLKSRLRGDDACPACAQRQWRISDPSYPIIQFTCEQCGHIVRTDLTSIDDDTGI